MTHIVDQGSVFDAPVDVVWKYLSAPDHGPSHKNTRNAQMKPISENQIEINSEDNVGGDWVKATRRITMFPPTGMIIEITAGPLAGSKMFNLYHPKGSKTEVTIVGDFVSKQIPADRLEPAVRGMLEMIYNEDVAGLKSFHKK